MLQSKSKYSIVGMRIVSRWEDNGERYTTVKLPSGELCDVKKTYDGLLYVMQCNNGKEVYNDGSDVGIRKMDKAEEITVLQFVEEIAV